MSRSEGQSSPSLNINTFSSCSSEWNTRVNSVPKIWYLWIYNLKEKTQKKKNGVWQTSSAVWLKNIKNCDARITITSSRTRSVEKMYIVQAHICKDINYIYLSLGKAAIHCKLCKLNGWYDFWKWYSEFEQTLCSRKQSHPQ